MRTLLGSEIGQPQTVLRAGMKLPVYWLVFASRAQKGIDIWNRRRKPGEQYELPLLGL